MAVKIRRLVIRRMHCVKGVFVEKRNSMFDMKPERSNLKLHGWQTFPGLFWQSPSQSSTSVST